MNLKTAAALVEGVVPVLREYIDSALQPLGSRCDAVDAVLRELREQQDALRADILGTVEERMAQAADDSIHRHELQIADAAERLEAGQREALAALRSEIDEQISALREQAAPPAPEPVVPPSDAEELAAILVERIRSMEPACA